MQINPSTDNNGAIVTKYYLYRDDGDYSSTLNITETGYDGVSLTYTVTGLTPGVIYRFAVAAQNSIGLSPMSYQTTAKTIITIKLIRDDSTVSIIGIWN